MRGVLNEHGAWRALGARLVAVVERGGRGSQPFLNRVRGRRLASQLAFAELEIDPSRDRERALAKESDRPDSGSFQRPRIRMLAAATAWRASNIDHGLRAGGPDGGGGGPGQVVTRAAAEPSAALAAGLRSGWRGLRSADLPACWLRTLAPSPTPLRGGKRGQVNKTGGSRSRLTPVLCLFDQYAMFLEHLTDGSSVRLMWRKRVSLIATARRRGRMIVSNDQTSRLQLTSHRTSRFEWTRPSAPRRP